MMNKKTIVLIAIITILFTAAAIAATSASISIGLTISEIGEYSGEDDNGNDGNGNDTDGTGIGTQNQTDDEGVTFSFSPSGSGVLEEKEYGMKIITNTDFELEYFWENYDNIDPRVSAFLNLEEEDYTYDFRTIAEFKNFINDSLLVGKNPVERPKVILQSSELNFKPDKELKFKVVYDPNVIQGGFTGTNTENILRVIVTFLPPSEL
jgi:hypothetical protein